MMCCNKSYVSVVSLCPTHFYVFQAMPGRVWATLTPIRRARPGQGLSRGGPLPSLPVGPVLPGAVRRRQPGHISVCLSLTNEGFSLPDGARLTHWARSRLLFEVQQEKQHQPLFPSSQVHGQKAHPHPRPWLPGARPSSLRSREHSRFRSRGVQPTAQDGHECGPTQHQEFT